MKLSIEELAISSYANCVNSNELTEIKGGTSYVCTNPFNDVTLDIINWFLGEDGSDGAPDQGDQEVCTSTSTTIDENGCEVTTTTQIQRDR